MSKKFDVKKKSNKDSREDLKSRKKMRGKTKMDKMEHIRTTSDFLILKETGIIFRFDSALYVLWDQRYRNQDNIRKSQNGEP